MAWKKVGRVTLYNARRKEALLKLSGTLSVGAEIRIKGPKSIWVQRVGSLRIDHKPVRRAWADETVWLKVTNAAHPGDDVFLREEPEPPEPPGIPGWPPSPPPAPEPPPPPPPPPRGPSTPPPPEGPGPPGPSPGEPGPPGLDDIVQIIAERTKCRGVGG